MVATFRFTVRLDVGAVEAVTVNVADVPSVTAVLSAVTDISGVVAATSPGHVCVDSTTARLTLSPIDQDISVLNNTKSTALVPPQTL